MAAPYQAVPSHVKERLQIAILCQESMNLHWEDESTGMNYLQRVTVLGMTEDATGEYLDGAVLPAGTPCRIRLDMVKNWPLPVK